MLHVGVTLRTRFQIQKHAISNVQLAKAFKIDSILYIVSIKSIEIIK